MAHTHEYIPTLTPLRGIAALLIVLVHFAPFFPIIKEVGLPYKNHLWVDFFFILSGFVIALSYSHYFRAGFSPKDYGKFIGRRLLRLYPVHLATLAAMIAIEFYRISIYHNMNTELPVPSFGDEVGGEKSMPAIYFNLLLVQSWGLEKGNSWNLPAWSISCEWFVAVLFPILVRWIYSCRTTLFPLIVCLVGYAAVFWIDHPNSYINVTLYQALFGFCAGMALYRQYASDEDQAKILGNSFLLTILMVLSLYYLDFFFENVYSVVFYALIVYGTAHNRGYFSRILMNPVLQFLGNISFSLYMVHFVVLNGLDLVILDHYGRGIATFTPEENNVILAVFLVATFVLSTLSYYLLERWVPRMIFKPEPVKTYVRQFESSDRELLDRFSKRLDGALPK